MIKTTSTTAVLIFSLNAKEEACRKPLFKEQKDSCRFYQGLLKQTLKITQDLDADVLWINGHKQKGADFASRLSHAFLQTYAMGYEQVIAIGNDCPELTKDHLHTAIAQLRKNKIVAGPSRDGGVYLIGMQRSYFNPSVFKAFPWQQDQLYNAILEEAYLKNVSVFSLDGLQDLDVLEDVFAFAKEKPHHSISRLIIKISTLGQRTFNQFSVNSSSNIFSLFFSLRAPPLSCAL